jgi:hypothetical protein
VVGLAKIFYPGMPVSPRPTSMETLEPAAAPADATETTRAPSDAPAVDSPAKAAAPAQEGAKP